MTPGAGRGRLCFAGDRASQTALPLGRKGFRCPRQAEDLRSVSTSGDREHAQAPVNTDPALVITLQSGLVLVGGVQVSGFDVERHPPA